MAIDVANIKVSPEVMTQQADSFLKQKDIFDKVISDMQNLVTTLCDEWAGKSSQSFSDQFTALKPGLLDTSNLIEEISSQLKSVSAAMQDMDYQISQKIGVSK